jgi:hypothetical protein
MMSVALLDVPTVLVSVPETKPVESNHIETSVDTTKPRTKVQEPVHFIFLFHTTFVAMIAFLSSLILCISSVFFFKKRNTTRSG